MKKLFFIVLIFVLSACAENITYMDLKTAEKACQSAYSAEINYVRGISMPLVPSERIIIVKCAGNIEEFKLL